MVKCLLCIDIFMYFYPLMSLKLFHCLCYSFINVDIVSFPSNKIKNDILHHMFIYLMNVFFNNFFFAELLLMAPVIFDIQENYIVPQNAVFIINTQNKSMQGKKLHKRLSFICLFIYIVSRFITRAVCRFYQNNLIQKLWYSFSRFLFVQKKTLRKWCIEQKARDL